MPSRCVITCPPMLAPEKTVLINLGNVGLIGARARDIQVHTKVRR